MKRQRICIDMDDTMADTVGEHLSRYNAEHGTGVTKKDLHGKWLWDHVPEGHRDDLLRYMSSDDFFEDLDVLPDCVRVVQRLQEHYEIFIASAAMTFPNSFNSKFRWLVRHFPFIPYTHIVFCGNKSILHADYLIDDMPKYLQLFEGQGVLYSAPHNALVTGYPRVENWLAVEEYFLPGGKARG